MRDLKLVSQAESFEAIFLKAMDDGLMVLCESARPVIHFRLEIYHSLRKDKIPRRLKDFSSATRKTFGSGGPVIEKLILRRLCEKLSVDYENVKEKEFQAAAEELKRRSAGPM